MRFLALCFLRSQQSDWQLQGDAQLRLEELTMETVKLHTEVR